MFLLRELCLKNTKRLPHVWNSRCWQLGSQFDCGWLCVVCNMLAQRVSDAVGRVVVRRRTSRLCSLVPIEPQSVVPGHQSLQSPERVLSTVFNGEIYNFAGLRRLLEQLRSASRSHSDTEVLLHPLMVMPVPIAYPLFGYFLGIHVYYGYADPKLRS